MNICVGVFVCLCDDPGDSCPSCVTKFRTQNLQHTRIHTEVMEVNCSYTDEGGAVTFVGKEKKKLRCYVWNLCGYIQHIYNPAPQTHTHTHTLPFCPLISSTHFPPARSFVCVKGQSSTCGFEAWVSHD